MSGRRSIVSVRMWAPSLRARAAGIASSILPLQTGHADELLGVGSDEDCAPSPGLPRQKDVVGADRYSCGFQLGAYGSSGLRIVFVEQGPVEWASEEGFESLPVAVLSLALRDSIPELGRHDRRQQNHAVAGHGALESASDVGLCAVDQRDAGVRIKQVCRHRRRHAVGWMAVGGLPA